MERRANVKKIFSASIITFLAVAALACSALSEGTQETVAREYEPNWESLDTRPIPEWFNEAKFGIFVVWGPYSVPAWVDKGYAEWYGQRMRRPKDPAHAFHIKNYGADFKYEQFAPMFKAELWDPDFWADLIEKSGAKYVSLTVNYHDGFAMWPTNYSKTAETDKWNSMVVGPKRDIAGEFEAACTKKGIKFGIYYSLYEWFHPLWNADKERFATEWMHPKFKEVVTKYKPWYIFLDGEWDAHYKTWHSEELAAWLYNESPVKDYVVANDRWGKTRGKHGDVFSSEYGGAEGWADHPWEENRGMGQSYGYNRNENVYDYNSAKELIDMLTKCAMNGGNLLLDIGPTGDGRIPVIMQERLLQIGDWLRVNGEAIYGTRRWRVTNEDTVRYTTKGTDVYAICTEWPGEKLVLKTPKLAAEATVTMLGCPKKVDWRMQGGTLHIDVPQLTVDELPCRHAWVFRLGGAA
jgi:alpha-L-fucosidase